MAYSQFGDGGDGLNFVFVLTPTKDIRKAVVKLN